MRRTSDTGNIEGTTKVEVLSASNFIYHTLLELRITNIKKGIFNNLFLEQNAKDNINDCIRKLGPLKEKGLKARLINNFLVDLRVDLFYRREGEFKEKLDILIDLVLRWMTRTEESYQSHLARESR